MKSLSNACFCLLVFLLTACPATEQTSAGSAAPAATPTPEPTVTLSDDSPSTNAFVDFPYRYTPMDDVTGATITVDNLPAWLTLDVGTGTISGIPDTVAVHSDVKITIEQGGLTRILGPFSITVHDDPLVADSWHLGNTGQTSYSLSAGTSGEDSRVKEAWRLGYSGSGVRIAVSDEGMEIAHEDLQAHVLKGESRNYRLAAPYYGNPTNTGSAGDHGTSVTGIIGAVGWNGIGTRGVAPNAHFAGLNFLYDNFPPLYRLLNQASGKFDVFNQSWGYGSTRNYVPTPPDYLTQVAYMGRSGRSGKGSIFVKSSGNYRRRLVGVPYDIALPSNTDGDNNMSELIVVGALKADGKATSYSSSGSNLWVSAPGGDVVSVANQPPDSPSIVTLDQSGCNKGYSTSTTTGDPFQSGGAPNTLCNYTSYFSGTSAAAPFVTGVVALILEANPNLTSRDVKYVLAKTATKVDPLIADFLRPGLDPDFYVYEDAWATNAAGFPFHVRYGFGRVNAEAAVTLAKTYVSGWGALTQTLDNNGGFHFKSGAINLAIPDEDAAGVTNQINVTTNLAIEAVQIKVNIDHTYVGDVAIELTAPSGTKSIVVPANNAVVATGYTAAVFLSNAFYGETSVGNWTIRVLDGLQNDVGTLKSWEINVIGHTP